ncbi:glycosyl hydrolase [Sphingobium sp. BYY-5]|uniref:glycosyl hydrolase n=1 Tax=Sphingobium sp. BYY-5 TaxID=2926400 RepID=UPI00325C1ABA
MTSPSYGAETANDPLAAGFSNPPAEARPRVWWHWMNGNVTKEGIDADLEWLASIGIAGVQNFDAALKTPVLVPDPAEYLSPQWDALFKHAVQKANALGLEFAISASPGWSETGGPWVKPGQAMKKLVWSSVDVKSGARSISLPKAPCETGPFQTLHAHQGFSAGLTGRPFEKPPAACGDVAVIAVPVPAGQADIRPRISISSGEGNSSILDDDVFDHFLSIPYTGDREAWVRFDFDRPQSIAALSFVAERVAGRGPAGARGPRGIIEALAADGRFRTIGELPVRGSEHQTVSFPSTRSTTFRVRFSPPETVREGSALPPLKIAELRLHSRARIHRFEDKAGFGERPDWPIFPTPQVRGIAQYPQVLDISQHLKADGTLDWKPSGGRWTIYRFGWSLEGHTNGPASARGEGLEVDKLNRNHVRDYVDKYLANYQSALNLTPLGANSISYVMTDSFEAGPSNWTEGMLAEFRQRRGYDLTCWLPVLAGEPLDSSERSEAVLWDFRKTLGEMIADEHYGELSTELKSRGMGRYGEAHESGRAFVGDGMAVKASATIPMGAMWARREGQDAMYEADIRESASVARIYGQNLVAAESFTASGDTYAFSPAGLKATADREMSYGLNRFVIHTSVHQPLEAAGPGVGLGSFGQWFTRKESWASEAGAWIQYLGRSSYLLQQGRAVADIAYFYSEDDNITNRFATAGPKLPDGYSFDYMSADALEKEMTVQDGRLVAPGGASYAVLAIDPQATEISLPVLRKLLEAKRAGVPIIGRRPIGSPSLTDDRLEWDRVANAIWSTDMLEPLERSVGQALDRMGLAPDFSTRAYDGPKLAGFVHRLLPDADIYFLANTSAEAVRFVGQFRVADRVPEIWKAVDGSMAPVSYRVVGDRMELPLVLQGGEALFVVFRGKAPASRWDAPTIVQKERLPLTSTWSLQVPGARIQTPWRLRSWTESSDDAIKYFSGTAVYKTTVDIPSTWLGASRQVKIDLGGLREMARVKVNGIDAGLAWTNPYALNISKAVRPGRNIVEIAVTNLWPNRLIGDQQPGYDGPRALAVFNPYTKESKLLPSGLMGPVSLVLEERVEADGHGGNRQD